MSKCIYTYTYRYMYIHMQFSVTQMVFAVRHKNRIYGFKKFIPKGVKFGHLKRKCRVISLSTTLT